MLTFSPKSTSYYLVYPSWARLKDKWEDLPILLNNPVETDETGKPLKELHKGNTRIWMHVLQHLSNYDLQHHRIDFIDGPEGGGIINYEQPYNFDQPKKSLNWRGHLIFNIEDYIWEGTTLAPEHCGVSYITQRGNRLFEQFGIEKRTTQYHLDASFDHVESVGDKLYLAFIRNTDKKYTKRCLNHFIELAKSFQIEVAPIESCPTEIMQEKPYWFRSRWDHFTWFQLWTDIQEARRLFAFLIYCGLALKSNAPQLQLVGQIEGKPGGHFGYHTPPLSPEEEEEKMRIKREAMASLKNTLAQLPPEIVDKALRNMKMKAKDSIELDDKDFLKWVEDMDSLDKE